MTLDLDALRREAEEGLAIAERAPDGPWVRWVDNMDVFCKVTHNGPYSIAGIRVCAVEADEFDGLLDEADDDDEVDEACNEIARDASAFIADVRTRAPNAYRNVSLLCDLLQESERRLTEAQADAEHLRDELDLAEAARDDWKGAWEILKEEQHYPDETQPCKTCNALAELEALRDEVQRIDQKLHATENMNAELAEACSNAIEEIDAWKAKYVAEKTMRQNAEQNEAEARKELERVTPTVEAAVVWCDRFNPRTDPDEDEVALCSAVNGLYHEIDAGWRARCEAARDILGRRRDSENCGAQHLFAEWPEAPACNLAKGHEGPHENGCFSWGIDWARHL